MANRPHPTPVRASHGKRIPILVPTLLTLAGALVVAAATSRRRGAPLTSFADHVVVITGGTRGLGLALARAFATQRAKVVLLSRGLEDVSGISGELRAMGARDVQIETCDVRDQSAVDATVAAIVRTHGRIDMLVNNAGVIFASPFEHAQLEDFDDSIKTHFWGPLYLIRACLPHMKQRRAGRIVNISSIGGRATRFRSSGTRRIGSS